MSTNSDRHGLWTFIGAVVAALIGGVFTMMAAHQPGPAPAPAQPAPSVDPPAAAAPAAAEVSTLWLEHNVTENGQVGMRIHARVSTSGRKGVEHTVYALFYDSTGTPLRDSDGVLVSSDGNVTVSQDFVPAVNETSAQDLTMFFPATELDLPPGKYSLTVRLHVFDHARDQVTASSEGVGFVYTRGEPAPQPAPLPAPVPVPPPAPPAPPPPGDGSNALATISDLWLEHNVFVDGVKGLRIHAQIRVVNERGRLISMGAFVYWKGGAALRDTNGRFRSGDGSVSVDDEQTPTWDDTVWQTFSLFLPYNELELSTAANLELRLAVEDLTTHRHLAVSPPVAFDFTP